MKNKFLVVALVAVFLTGCIKPKPRDEIVEINSNETAF